MLICQFFEYPFLAYAIASIGDDSRKFFFSFFIRFSLLFLNSFFSSLEAVYSAMLMLCVSDSRSQAPLLFCFIPPPIGLFQLQAYRLESEIHFFFFDRRNVFSFSCDYFFVWSS